jgi:hypothetical protein
MIRRIKKSFGKISLLLFILAIPLTFFNIMFSDPAPYFTLCTFGCFSVENCTTKDQNWGNYTSLSFVFSLAFLLSAEVLAIRFNYLFIKFTTPEVRIMVDEVNEKYNKGKESKGNRDDSENAEAGDTKYPVILTRQGISDDKGDIHSEFEDNKNEITNMNHIFQDHTSNKFKTELSKVSHTVKPIRYHS